MFAKPQFLNVGSYISEKEVQIMNERTCLVSMRKQLLAKVLTDESIFQAQKCLLIEYFEDFGSDHR
jgi:hypothetical protein